MYSATLLAVLGALATANAQNSTVNTTEYLGGLAQVLAQYNLTTLATISQQVGTTNQGMTLLSLLPQGNKTLFAPTNHAFTGVPKNISGNVDVLADVLTYHLVEGTFSPSSFATNPADTVVRTYLNDSKYVQLEAGLSQVMTLQNLNSTPTVSNQNTPVVILNSTTYQNLVINIVDSVIDIPPTMSNALNSYNLTTLVGAVQEAGLLGAIESTHGITVFAPAEGALSNANLTGVDAKTLGVILGNHVINGSTVYSSTIQGNASQFVSASGQPFSFSVNGTGTFVTMGGTTAQITRPDVLVENGVVHIINGFFADTSSNTTQAASAFQSYSSMAAMEATMEATATGPIGYTPSPSGSGSSKSSAAREAVSLGLASWTLAAAVATLGAVAGSALLF